MILKDFKIIKRDEYNYTFERYMTTKYRSPIDGKTMLEKTDWKQVSGYYGSIESALNGLKDYIVGELVNETNEYDELLSKIKDLQDCIVSVNIKERKTED